MNNDLCKIISFTPQNPSFPLDEAQSAIHEIYQKTLSEEHRNYPVDDLPENLIKRIDRNYAYVVLIALVKNIIVGFAVLQISTKPPEHQKDKGVCFNTPEFIQEQALPVSTKRFGQLLWLAVDPAYAGKGIGNALFKTACDTIRQWDRKYLYLYYLQNGTAADPTQSRIRTRFYDKMTSTEGVVRRGWMAPHITRDGAQVYAKVGYELSPPLQESALSKAQEPEAGG